MTRSERRTNRDIADRKGELVSVAQSNHGLRGEVTSSMSTLKWT